jgi:hypothetical protein
MHQTATNAKVMDLDAMLILLSGVLVQILAEEKNTMLISSTVLKPITETSCINLPGKIGKLYGVNTIGTAEAEV